MNPPPTFVTVARREPQTGLQNIQGEERIHARPPLDFVPHGAPVPIRYSDWYDVGKPEPLTWGHQPIAVYLNIPNRLAVMRDLFLTGKVRAQFLTLMRNGLGGQAPLPERVNIDRPDSRPYGDLAQIQGESSGRSARVPVSANGLTYDNSQWW